MKLQIDGQHIRLRLSEAQLDTLIKDGMLQARLKGPGDWIALRTLLLEDELAAPYCAGNLHDLSVYVPRSRFLAFAHERPRRDGFHFFSNQLELDIEIDVRESRKRQIAENLSPENSSPPSD